LLENESYYIFDSPVRIKPKGFVADANCFLFDWWCFRLGTEPWKRSRKL